jgi:hypothetical protein
VFIERLVMMGKDFLNASPQQAGELVTDAQNAPGFLQNVVVLEMDTGDEGRVAALPLQTWGETVTVQEIGRRKPREKFLPDMKRALGALFLLPSGGNPRAPQGKYGIAVYPVYQAMWTELAVSAQAFLIGRLTRTLHPPCSNLELAVPALEAKLQGIAGEVASRIEKGVTTGSGLLIIVAPTANGAYRIENTPPEPNGWANIGASILNPGKRIWVDLKQTLEWFLEARVSEGESRGTAQHCSVCGTKGQSVSVYSAVWPMATPTWHAPFPEQHKQGGKVHDMASITGALCPPCYRALVLGAGLFDRVSGNLDNRVTKELFAPSASLEGREAAGRSTRRDRAVLVTAQRPQVPEGSMAEAYQVFRHSQPRETRRDRQLLALTGLERYLPEEMTGDDFQLTMVYFTRSNADFRLRALIDEICPSTMQLLVELLVQAIAGTADLAQALSWRIRDEYQMLPFLLARAYGGAYLWISLQQTLHRQPLNWQSFVAGAAARIASAGRNANLHEGEKHWHFVYLLKEEIYFYWLFREVYLAYTNKITGNGGMELRNWKEMLQQCTEAPPEEMRLENPEELGFAAGVLVRRFSRKHYGKLKKDFLKQRVLTFGASLKPEDLWRNALIRFMEVSLQTSIPLEDDFRRRAAVVESEYRRMRDVVARNRDEFMGAFWSGYMLAPKPMKLEEQDEIDSEGGEE